MSQNDIDVEKIMNCTKFGPFIIGEPFEKNFDLNGYQFGEVHAQDFLTELRGEELQLFQNSGASAEYSDERVFESEPFDYYGIEGWIAIISTHQGDIYKIGVRSMNTPNEVKLLRNAMSSLFEKQLKLGAPHRTLLNRNVCTWQTPYSEIRMAMRTIPKMNLAQLNLVIRGTGKNIFELTQSGAT